VAVGLEWAQAQFVGQGEGFVIVGLGWRGIGRGGVRIEDTKLVQRERFVSTCLLLPGQVKRLVSVLPSFIAASRQTTDLAEPSDPQGTICQRARAHTSADRLLQ